MEIIILIKLPSFDQRGDKGLSSQWENHQGHKLDKHAGRGFSNHTEQEAMCRNRPVLETLVRQIATMGPARY